MANMNERSVWEEILINAELNSMANGASPSDLWQAIEDYDWTVEDGGPLWRVED